MPRIVSTSEKESTTPNGSWGNSSGHLDLVRLAIKLGSGIDETDFAL